MAEKAKTPKKLKLLNFAKVLGICLGGVFGLIAISLAVIAITGGFRKKKVELENLKFEQNVYVIDGNLEKTVKQDGTSSHIDYQIKLDENKNPIYQTIKAIPTNEECTELDATLTIINGKSLQLVSDENTKVYGQTQSNEQTQSDEQKQNNEQSQQTEKSNVWHDKYSIKLKSNIKVVPATETKTFVDANGSTFQREVNVGGWSLLQIEQGLHIAYCYVFVDVPVYDYQIVANAQDGLTEYQPTGEEQEDEFVPNYIVNNTNASGGNFAFTLKNGTIIPTTSFDTLYSTNPSTNNKNISLGFDLQEEIEKLYPQKYKQIIYKSSDESVATISQNANNTATVTIQPNSYGKTFEINSYVVSIYNDQYKIPQLEEYKKHYPTGEAEEKYNQDFDKIRKFSLNSLKFRVNTLEIENFEVSQTSLNYYVFDESIINLTRDGSSKQNTKTDEQSIFNFTITLNQHFADEQARLDEILNNIVVSAVYKDANGEYVEYIEDDAIFVLIDALGTKKLVINRQDTNLSYLRFEYKPDEDADAICVAYCPIQISVKNATLSISKSSLNLAYYKKPVEDVVGDSVNNNTNVETELNPTLSTTNSTYSKIMYFINFAQNSDFVQVDQSKKISVSGEDFYALTYSAQGQTDVSYNNILRLTNSGSNARLVVAIVKTELPDGQGEVIEQDGYIQYYALATNVLGSTYVSVSAEEQFEIDKCVLVVGEDASQIDLDNLEQDNHITDLYNTIENPVIALSKLDEQGESTYATFVMKYYGTKLDNSNFFVDFSKINGVVSYAESTQDGIFYLTFSAITDGTAIVSINAYSNPTWSKTITFNVTNDAINTLVLTNNNATDNIVDVEYNVSSDKITFNDVEFDLTIEPNDSQASSTFARAFSLSQSFKESLCEQLGIDLSTATTKEILSRLNSAQYDRVRKTLGELSGDSNIIDILSYKSLDNKLTAKVVSSGEALVLVFAMTNGDIALASDAYVIRVPQFELASSTFEQEQIYNTLGDLRNNLIKISGGINDGITPSPTQTSYNIVANNQFTLNGGSIDFEILKFAFANGELTSANGSTMSNGIITFGAVDQKLTETLYAYIGNSLSSNFCKFEMRFVLDPDYNVKIENSTITANANQYIDLFELVDKDIEGVIQKVPSIIVTNKQENMLFLPYNYDDSKLAQFGTDFLNKFYYSDAGGQEYYHIYKSITFTGNIISGNIVGGLVKFAQSGTVNIVATGSNSGTIIATINVNVIDAPQPTVLVPNFTDMSFDGNDASISDNIAFTPDNIDIQVTSITFDVDGLNNDDNYNSYVTFREENGTLIADVDYMGMQMSLNLLTIAKNGDIYTLSKADGYDNAKSLLSMQGVSQLEFDLIVSYSYQSEENNANLKVTINFWLKIKRCNIICIFFVLQVC